MTRIRGRPTLEIVVALQESQFSSGAVQVDRRSTARASGPPRPITKKNASGCYGAYSSVIN